MPQREHYGVALSVEKLMRRSILREVVQAPGTIMEPTTTERWGPAPLLCSRSRGNLVQRNKFDSANDSPDKRICVHTVFQAVYLQRTTPKKEKLCRNDLF